MTARAWLHDPNTICVSVPFAAVERLKDAEPSARWENSLRAFVVPSSSAPTLAQALDDLDIDEGVAALLGPADPDAHWKTCDEADLPPVPGLPNGGWVHQRRAFWWSLNKDAAYLAIGMGGGKTATTAALIRKRGHRRVLVVCPKKVVGHWPVQLDQYGVGGAFYGLDRDGSVPKRLEVARLALDSARITNTRAVVVFNYATILNKEAQKLLQTAGFDLVVLDEAQNIKSHNGAISKALWQAFKKAKVKPKKLLLSGTPMPHSPADIFGQYRFLDERILGTSFTHFRARYAVMHPYLIHTIKEWVRQDEMAAKLEPLMFQVGRDVLDLPPTQHITQFVQIGPKARKAYDALEKDFYAEVDAGEVTASNALVKLLRLQQVAAGYVHTDDGHDIDIGTAKQEALSEILDGLPLREKVVVFCRFRHDLDKIRQAAESQQRRYGEVSGRQDDLVDSKFPPDIDVLGVQIQAGGAGIDLSAAAYCVYYTVGFSLGDYEQSLARTHRPGQTRSVTYYHLVSEGTVDSRVYAALDQRRDVVRAILDRIV